MLLGSLQSGMLLENLLCICTFKQLEAWGTDGETMQIMLPSENEVSNMVLASEKQHKSRMGNILIFHTKCTSLVFFLLYIYSFIFRSSFMAWTACLCCMIDASVIFH